MKHIVMFHFLSETFVNEATAVASEAPYRHYAFVDCTAFNERGVDSVARWRQSQKSPSRDTLLLAPSQQNASASLGTCVP